MQLWIFAFLLFFGHGFTLITPHTCPGCVKVRVGPPEVMYGPISHSLDNPFNTLRNGSSLLGYSANGNTYIIVNSTLNVTISADIAQIALKQGDTGNFDECGAWLNNAVIDGKTVRGWYHAERDCDYAVGKTLKSIAYAESTDGGRTFTKPNYPNNQIISGVTSSDADKESGNGDQSVVVGTDGYYYCFFKDLDQYKIAVARSPISSGGVPGTWFKYYNGNYSQPGIGGQTSAVPQLNSNTVMRYHNDSLLALNDYVSLTLTFGEGPLSWDLYETPLLFIENAAWQRSSTANELIGYSSFVPMDGSDILGDQFWLYYTYLLPGQGFDQRYQVRRLVNMTVESSVVTPQSATALVRYASTTDYWTTTAFATSDYKVDRVMGYLFPYNYPSTIQVFDCYSTSSKTHMLAVSRDECTGDMEYVRALGYVYTTAPSETTTPLVQIFRCHNTANNQYYVTTNKECTGQGNYDITIGYITSM